MELIRKLNEFKGNEGKRKFRLGLFLCPYCDEEVKKVIHNGKTQKSCGCVHNELIKKANTIHGGCINDKLTKLYSSWIDMKRRCYNPKIESYKYYGGRGIKVYKPWRRSYIWFKRWALKNGYKEGLTIDRIDNDGNYEPDNCKWSTAKEQARNRRSNKLITYKGETHCLTEWAEILGINENTFYSRLNGHGWSIEKTFTEKVKRRNKHE